MTLINDELKKSAAEREGDAAPLPPRSIFHRPLVSLFLIGAVIVGLLGTAGFLIYIALSPDKAPASAAEPALPAPAAEAPPAVAGAPEIEPAFAPPADPPAQPAEGAPAPVATPPAAPEFPAPLEDYMRSMQVAGIRVSHTDERAIINGRMYAVGEKLPISFELRLVAVAPGRLEFRDANGVIYRKHF